MNKFVIVIQARLSSKRLRNKILFHIYDDVSILEMIIKSLKSFTKIPIILATSSSIEDKKLRYFANKYNISFYSGSLNNVRKRIFICTKGYEVIFRFTADNPLVFKELIDFAQKNFNKYSYLGFKNYIRGSVFQVFKRDLIKNYKTCTNFEKEHVIDPKKIDNKYIKDMKMSGSKIKLSIDTIEDYFFTFTFIKRYFYKYKRHNLKNFNTFLKINF